LNIDRLLQFNVKHLFDRVYVKPGFLEHTGHFTVD